MNLEIDFNRLSMLRAMAQRLADETKEPVLLMTINNPRRSFVDGLPYCVLLSQADEFERSNAYQMFHPGGVAISGEGNGVVPKV